MSITYMVKVSDHDPYKPLRKFHQVYYFNLLDKKYNAEYVHIQMYVFVCLMTFGSRLLWHSSDSGDI